MVILASAQSLVKLSAAEKRRETQQKKKKVAGKRSYLKLNKNIKLTYYHHTDEQADYYPDHPEQPLRGRDRGASTLFQVNSVKKCEYSEITMLQHHSAIILHFQ